MTTAAANRTSAKNHAGASIDQPDQVPSTLTRLLDYMVGGDQRSRLILGVISRIVALLGLTALPFITGQAMNVINGPSGNLEQLYRWVLYGLVAGVIYLLIFRRVDIIPLALIFGALAVAGIAVQRAK